MTIPNLYSFPLGIYMYHWIYICICIHTYTHYYLKCTFFSYFLDKYSLSISRSETSAAQGIHMFHFRNYEQRHLKVFALVTSPLNFITDCHGSTSLKSVVVRPLNGCHSAHSMKWYVATSHFHDCWWDEHLFLNHMFVGNNNIWLRADVETG